MSVSPCTDSGGNGASVCGGATTSGGKSRETVLYQQTVSKVCACACVLCMTCLLYVLGLFGIYNCF